MQSATEVMSEPIETVQFAELKINEYTSELVELNKPPSINKIESANNNLALNSYQRRTTYPLQCYN